MKLRQRSKAELLRQRQIYEAMVRDSHEEHNIRGGVQHWVTEVAWAWVLMSREGFSGNEINSLIQHTRGYDIGDMPQGLRDALTEKTRAAGITADLTTRSMDIRHPRRSRMDRAVGELHEYNARVMTDYRLAACEYLRDVKGFGRKRLERVMALEAVIESADTDRMQEMRGEVFDRKGIWIQMCDGDEPE
jgi:hypothetical protein